MFFKFFTRFFLNFKFNTSKIFKSCIFLSKLLHTSSMFQVLKMMTGKNLTDAQLQQIVDKTILYLDKDADGKISFEEFKQVVEERGTESDITKMLSVDAAKI